MKTKTAQRSLTALRHVFKDCKQRFGSIPTGVTSDDGAEFKAVFDEFLVNKNIERKIVRLCSWVEARNSTLARAFAVMRNIHGFNKSLELSLQKVNNIQSRINRKAPVEWTAADFQKSTRRYNKKLKKHPTPREQPEYNVNDRVRYMLKKALGKDPFYKSYEGMRKKSHHMWSKQVFAIKEKRRRSGELIYKVNGKWRPAYELQLIAASVITLSKPTQKPVSKAKQKAKKSVTRPAKARLLIPRRSKRQRLAPARYGFP